MNKLKQLGRKHESDNYQICSIKAKHVVILNNTYIFLRCTILNLGDTNNTGKKTWRDII